MSAAFCFAARSAGRIVHHRYCKPYNYSMLSKDWLDGSIPLLDEFSYLNYAFKPTHVTYAAQRAGCKRKNRYINILPYDHSRVILRGSGSESESSSDYIEEDCSDYINATLIRGAEFSHPSADFVAMQGPLDGTVADMYQMCIQEGSGIIIMLTKFEERGYTKCAPYFNDERPMSFGRFTVVVDDKVPLMGGKLMQRTLSVTEEGTPSPYIISHYSYLGWPDHDVPNDAEGLLKMVDTLDNYFPAADAPHTSTVRGPAIVHCSAGVGRTGTIMTIYYAHRSLLREGANAKLNLFEIVGKLRSHRKGMVQQPSQYGMCYRAVAEDAQRLNLCSLQPEAIAEAVPEDSEFKKWFKDMSSAFTYEI